MTAALRLKPKGTPPTPTDAAPPSIFQPTVTGDPPSLRDEAVRAMIDRIGDRWSLLVLLSLSAGCKSHRNLALLVPRAPTRALTLTIRRLCEDGLIVRISVSNEALANEYTLTELGRSFLEPLHAMLAWAERNRAALAAARMAGEAQASSIRSGRPTIP